MTNDEKYLLSGPLEGERERAIYDAGHRDGESCREADYSFAFSELISDEAGFAAWNAMELAEWVKARIKPEFIQ